MAEVVDLTEFAELSKRDQRQRCKVGIARDQLATDEERAQLDAAIAAEDDITVGGIIKWLERRDQQASSAAVSSHRKRRCRCHAQS